MTITTGLIMSKQQGLALLFFCTAESVETNLITWWYIQRIDIFLVFVNMCACGKR